MSIFMLEFYLRHYGFVSFTPKQILNDQEKAPAANGLFRN